MKKPWNKPTVKTLNFEPDKHYFIRHIETGKFYHLTKFGYQILPGIEGAAMFDEITLLKFEPLLRIKNLEFEKVLVSDLLDFTANG